MPIADKILTYSVYMFQSNLVNYGRAIRLSLESGGIASIQFPEIRPTEWLQFSGNQTSLYMVQDQFTDVYHLLQSEKPVFFTATEFEGIQVGGVHTEFDLSVGEPTGEGDEDQSLAAVIRRAHTAQAKRRKGSKTSVKRRRKK
jgi:hypothetical protein